jgi:hypothetical protein
MLKCVSGLSSPTFVGATALRRQIVYLIDVVFQTWFAYCGHPSDGSIAMSASAMNTLNLIFFDCAVIVVVLVLFFYVIRQNKLASIVFAIVCILTLLLAKEVHDDQKTRTINHPTAAAAG